MNRQPTTNFTPPSHLDISRFQGLNIGLKTHRITDTWDSEETTGSDDEGDHYGKWGGWK